MDDCVFSFYKCMSLDIIMNKNFAILQSHAGNAVARNEIAIAKVSYIT